jgi:hypothetical protein
MKLRLATRLCDEICEWLAAAFAFYLASLADRLRRAKFDFNICKNPIR